MVVKIIKSFVSVYFVNRKYNSRNAEKNVVNVPGAQVPQVLGHLS